MSAEAGGGTDMRKPAICAKCRFIKCLCTSPPGASQGQQWLQDPPGASRDLALEPFDSRAPPPGLASPLERAPMSAVGMAPRSGREKGLVSSTSHLSEEDAIGVLCSLDQHFTPNKGPQLPEKRGIKPPGKRGIKPPGEKGLQLPGTGPPRGVKPAFDHQQQRHPAVLGKADGGEGGSSNGEGGWRSGNRTCTLHPEP